MANSSYVHLGSDVTVHNNDIIGIFDIERVTVNKDVNEFLKISQKSGKIYYVSLDLPKSFAVAANSDFEHKVYVTNVSTGTLKKRLNDKTQLSNVVGFQHQSLEKSINI